MVFSLIPHLLFSQYHFNFENDSSRGPGLCPGKAWQQVPVDRWNCSREQVIEGLFSLQHSFDNPENGCDYLLFNHDRVEESDSLVLTFRVRHGYTPSAANNWQVALLAEFGDEDGQILNGIAVGINFLGFDDLLKIWKCEPGSCKELCVSAVNFQEEVGIEAAPLVRLVWYKDGEIKLFFAKDPLVADPVQVGSCVLDQWFPGRQLIIRYAYSSARDRNLWFDNITLDGNFVKDTCKPTVTKVEVVDGTHVAVCFSEPIVVPSERGFLISNPGIDPGVSCNPDSLWVSGNEIFMEFPNPLPNRLSLVLRMENICDPDGNCLSDTLVALLRNEAVWGDLVITELMSDPDPSIRLPNQEYLELKNRTEFPMDLGNWWLEVNSRRTEISELISTSLLLEPFAYALLKGISLPNSGATVALYSREGTLIHAAMYRVPWDAPEWKKEGGWALESPDPDQPCMTSYWWEYSADPSGGTPGRINSNHSAREDNDPPVMLFYGYGDAGTLLLHYSEPVRIWPGIREEFKLRPGNLQPTEVLLSTPLSDELEFRFTEEVQKPDQFTMDLPGIADCRGNLSRDRELRGGLVSHPAFESILINEIMYHPMEGFPEYVELFNPGPDYFDLWNLSLHVVESGDPPDDPISISDRSRIILPGEYLVLTGCIPQLIEKYNLEQSGRWVELGRNPGMKISGGSIYLTDRSGAIVDLARYGDEMHLELLNDNRGISLERISATRPGSDVANWHSAASIAGYATPGEENSQAMDHDAGHHLLEVNPVVFSPDNDGYQDLLEINLTPNTNGWVIRLWISNLEGILVKQLANNHILGLSTAYSWDGKREDGSLVPGGIYVIHVLGYQSVTGERFSRKAAIGVVYR